MERPWPLSAHLLHPFAATLQVCSGLAFMHARRIVHCDLKPSNILSDGIDGSLVKVSDLGACLILPEGRDSLTVNTHVCTAPYQAPEVRSVPVPRLSSSPSSKHHAIVLPSFAPLKVSQGRCLS